MAAADLWEVPWVHTAHTLAAVKNNSLADDDVREPESRRICEQQIVDNADLLIVNTEAEVADLIAGYDASTCSIEVVAPGADVEHFTPGSDRATERCRRAGHSCAKVIGFVGRLQKFSAHLLLRAAAEVIRRHPEELVSVVVCGGSSGSNGNSLAELKELAEQLGIARCVRFLNPGRPKSWWLFIKLRTSLRYRARMSPSDWLLWRRRLVALRWLPLALVGCRLRLRMAGLVCSSMGERWIGGRRPRRASHE